jgi:hypothetical protein
MGKIVKLRPDTPLPEGWFVGDKQQTRLKDGREVETVVWYAHEGRGAVRVWLVPEGETATDPDKAEALLRKRAAEDHERARENLRAMIEEADDNYFGRDTGW